MRIGFKYGRHFQIIDDFAVRLIGHQINTLAEFLTGGFQYLTQLGQFRCRIDRTGRVIGRIDQHHPGFIRNRGFDGSRVQVKGCIRWNGFNFSLGNEGIVVIADKIGGGGQNFLTGVENGPDRVV